MDADPAVAAQHQADGSEELAETAGPTAESAPAALADAIADLVPTDPEPEPQVAIAAEAPAPAPAVFESSPQQMHEPMKETEKMASNFDYNRMQEAATGQTQQFQAGVQQATEQVRQQSEEALRQGQAALQQATERSREVMDRGMKAFDDFNLQARGNADVWMNASRSAAQGLETIVQQAAEFSRKTFETATAAMRTMAAAKTPNDVMQAQNDFAKAQFDTMVSEFSRLTETMMKVSSSVFEPLQSHMTDAAHKASDAMKNVVTPPSR